MGGSNSYELYASSHAGVSAIMTPSKSTPILILNTPCKIDNPVVALLSTPRYAIMAKNKRGPMVDEKDPTEKNVVYANDPEAMGKFMAQLANQNFEIKKRREPSEREALTPAETLEKQLR